MRRYVTGLNFLAPDVGCANPFARLSNVAFLAGDTSLQSSLDVMQPFLERTRSGPPTGRLTSRGREASTKLDDRAGDPLANAGGREAAAVKLGRSSVSRQSLKLRENRTQALGECTAAAALAAEPRRALPNMTESGAPLASQGAYLAPWLLLVPLWCAR